MSPAARPSLLLIAALAAATLAGCASVNERVSAGVADSLPQWAGGLPSDAPPRPGTAKYDEYMKERERLRQMPASERPAEQPKADGAPPLDPVR
ncbi:hypothetical protein [Bradyrhizobium sp. NP1]|jgi:hypothetical protein|uniref:hypothetical protein n=1 Tax=Bradyrhizobium sp. NP1 TaxID=3049772 RepID=UPI0025A643AC|nr:hypothetical protein [Bradyrhizobium sp. NP1]WJR76337.1 hypothetical protein QOU61_26730 [Bradyrhizobium sp. NP1]